jgi:hypothetical protein
VCTNGLRPRRNSYPAAARCAGNRLELAARALIRLPCEFRKRATQQTLSGPQVARITIAFCFVDAAASTFGSLTSAPSRSTSTTERDGAIFRNGSSEQSGAKRSLNPVDLDHAAGDVDPAALRAAKRKRPQRGTAGADRLGAFGMPGTARHNGVMR